MTGAVALVRVERFNALDHSLSYAWTSERRELEYISGLFSSLEVNRSFYSLLTPKSCASWYAATPPGFEFSLKLFQDFTHKREVTKADVDTFKRGIDPLAKAEKLGDLL